jgi:hypothetical protein
MTSQASCYLVASRSLDHRSLGAVGGARRFRQALLQIVLSAYPK